MSGSSLQVFVSADGAFPELVRSDQVRGALGAVAGVRRQNGPPAALLVGRTRHGRHIVLEAGLAALAQAVDELRRAHGIELEQGGAKP